MLKMISPSAIKKLMGINRETLNLINNVVFASNKCKTSKVTNKNYLFVGNVVHNYIDYISENVSHNQALVSSVVVNHNNLKDINKPTNEIMETIYHNIDFAQSYLNGKDTLIEYKVFYESYKNIIGGTADIVIHNDDDTITIGDFKNYNNPSSKDLYKAYIQCLVYANLVKLDTGKEIKQIEIVYPSQEQVITLPYQDIDLDVVRYG